MQKSSLYRILKVGCSALFLALAATYTVSLNAAPKPRMRPDAMDSPIPPGRVFPIPEGIGYCVTYTDPAGLSYGLVRVPFHRPNRQNIEELRGSIRNALALLANQNMVRAAIEQDAKNRHQLTVSTALLLKGLQQGVRFPGEPKTDGVECSCTSLQDNGGSLPGGYACGGPCGNCWSCASGGGGSPPSPGPHPWMEE